MKIPVAPHFKTGNYSVTTALATLGFPWLDERAPCTNVYGEDDPIPRARDGSPTAPGNVTFYVKRASAAFPMLSLDEVTAQWSSGTADDELDEMIAADGSDSKEIRDLKARIREILPLAITCYLKSGLSNRRDVAGMFRNVNPMRVHQEDGATFLISADAPEEMRKEIGA